MDERNVERMTGSKSGTRIDPGGKYRVLRTGASNPAKLGYNVGMFDVAEAQRIVLDKVRPLPTTKLPLREALYRTLAAPICTDLDDPPFDRAVMDGYAVRSADVGSVPVNLKVVGQVAAGSLYKRRVGTGEAVQINTGAPMPDGADAVVRVEATQADAAHRVLIRESASAGQFVTRRGAYARAGQEILRPGDRLTPVHIGVAATTGAAQVTVYRQPRVAILTTGDELVDIDRRPTAAQIRNSNQYLLEALVRAAHTEPMLLGTAGDDRAKLSARIGEGLEGDVLCITGGVSAGAFDFVPDILKAHGACFHVHKMAIKPGRPTIFATTPAGKLIFALPGNPVSAFIGFELLVRPALAGLEGREAIPRPLRARLAGTLPAVAGRRSFFPARIAIADSGEYDVHTLSWHGSGDSLGMTGANAIIERAPNSPAARDGDLVSVYLLDRDG